MVLHMLFHAGNQQIQMKNILWKAQIGIKVYRQRDLTSEN